MNKKYEIYGVFFNGEKEVLTTCTGNAVMKILATKYAQNIRKSPTTGRFFQYITYREI